MSIKEQLKKDLTEAIRGRDEITSSVTASEAGKAQI